MSENDKPKASPRSTSHRRRKDGEAARHHSTKSADSRLPANQRTMPSIADRLLDENAERYRAVDRLTRRGVGGHNDNRSEETKSRDSKSHHPRWKKSSQPLNARREKGRVSSSSPIPPQPKPRCPRCDKPIDDLAAAVNDKDSDEPCHFDCVAARIGGGETLKAGEKIIYLGGGRFGVVYFDNPSDLRRFQIRKTIQWEEKDKRAKWRKEMADRFSAT